MKVVATKSGGIGFGLTTSHQGSFWMSRHIWKGPDPHSLGIWGTPIATPPPRPGPCPLSNWGLLKMAKVHKYMTIFGFSGLRCVWQV
jgi:hypothetical protein